VINSIVVGIPNSYGLLLRRNWSHKLKSYLVIDWSHLRLAWKGQQNQIRVNWEKYMKQIIIDLEDKNESIFFSNYVLGNYFLNLILKMYLQIFHPLNLKNILNSFIALRLASPTLNY
jgi:hypothetical protein